jgi:hypothetical protein
VPLYSLANESLCLHQHPGQLRAWDSEARIIAILAGTQGGKTSWLPLWLWREIERTADPSGGNDYLALTSSYDLFRLKFLPSMRDWFEHTLGGARYWPSGKILELADPETGRFWAKRVDDRMWGRIILRSAESKGGLESATAKAAIWDEAGQDVCTEDTYEAVRRRLLLHRGRLCLGTTLYNLGWLKAQIYDPWANAIRNGGRHPEIDVIQFNSAENPEFPREEYEAAESRMPKWKFDMQYRGLFTRPAGLIYDCFDEALHVIPPFAIPPEWRRYSGWDFGGINTASIFCAEDPESKILYLYRDYKASARTAIEHAYYALEPEQFAVPFCVGGSASESQWRNEFRKGGEVNGRRISLPMGESPVTSVEVGIDRVYGTIKRGGLRIFSTAQGVIGDLRSYRRKIDDQGNPTLTIEQKATYHYADALRYLLSRIR